MPPVAAAVAAAASAAFSGATLSAVFLSVAKSLAMSAFTKVVSGAFGAKQKKSAPEAVTTTGITRQFRQSISERIIVYGEARVSGPVVFVASTNNNQYLHMVIAIASHEIDSFQEFIVNNTSIPIDAVDGAGNVTSGPYKDNLRIKTYLGTATQAADPQLVSEVTQWTSDHKLSGIAYMYVRLNYNEDVYQSGIPNFSAWVKGRKVTDVREIALGETRVTDDDEIRLTESGEIRVTDDDQVEVTKKWSPNTALIAFDYLTDSRFGYGIATSDIDDVFADSAANICDEIVATKNTIATCTSADPSNDVLTLSGSLLTLFRGDRVQLGVTTITGLSTGTDYYVIPWQRQGTIRIKLASSLQNALDGVAINFTSSGTATIIKNGEPRYHCGGILSAVADRKKNTEEIAAAMAGNIVRTGKRWYINAGAYRSPDLSFDESDLHGPIKIDANAAKRDAFNKVSGAYNSQINGGNSSEYPVVQSTTYQDADLEVLDKKLDLGMVFRPQQCQRIGKQLMERERQEIRFTGKFSLAAYKLKVGDTFYFTFAKNGWNAKIFEVLEIELATETGNGAPVPIVNIVAKETAAECYSFLFADDEATVDPAPNTDLPNPFLVTTVLGFSLTSVPVFTVGGDRTFKINASWDAHENSFVTEGGQYEIQYSISGDNNWSSILAPGLSTSAELFQAQQDTLYDLRIRAYNNIGAKSQWSYINGFLVGSSSVATTEDWENIQELRHPADWENNTGANEDWET